MVLSISDFFVQKKGKRRPLLNQLPTNYSDQAVTGISSVLMQKQKFWKWFKTRPELNSPIMIRVDDTIGEVVFRSKDGTPLGRNTRLKAEKFWYDNQLYERLKSIQYDRLTTGSGFLWLGFADFEQIYGAVKRSMTNKYKDVATRQMVLNVFGRAIDEDLRTPRIVDYVPSSTVMIEHDRYEIKKYIQYFGAYSEVFKPEEIIHIPLIRADGKVDGFTPVESLTYELILLWAIKENMLAYMRNGGVPKRMFMLPEEMPNSENHQWLVQSLMDQGMMQNRHGNLVFTGKVEVEDLEKDIKDMEYKELALYVTSNIAYALRVPVSRIPYMIGQSQSKGDSGGLAESGYWSMIESDLRTLEMHLNSQLFGKLGFHIAFKRKYRTDSLKEIQAFNFRLDALTKLNNELAGRGRKLSEDKLLSMVSGVSGNCDEVCESDLEDLSEEEKLLRQSSGLLGRTSMPDGHVEESDKRAKNEAKRTASVSSPTGNGQSGF